LSYVSDVWLETMRRLHDHTSYNKEDNIMKFTIKLTNELGKRIIDYPMGNIGLDAVDNLRRDINIPDLDLSLIDANISCPSCTMCLTIELTEDQARQAGIFRGQKEIIVYIPDSYLGRYLSIKPDIEKEKISRVVPTSDHIKKFFKIIDEVKTYTREIRKVGFKYVICKSKIVEDWLNAGAPVYWDCKKVTKEEWDAIKKKQEEAEKEHLRQQEKEFEDSDI